MPLACLTLVIPLCLVWAQPPQSGDFQRFKVAVFNFGVTSLIDNAPPNLGEAMANEFGTPLFESRRFEVIDRRSINLVLQELELDETGLIRPEDAKRFGELAGVDIIVTGDITVFDADSYRVTARFTDVSTGGIVHQGTLSAANPLEFLEVAQGFVEQAKASFPLEGHVVALEGDKVFINLGIMHGLTGQDKTGVILREREIAGAGSTITERIGAFTVSQIFEELSIISPVMNEGVELRIDDIVRVQLVEVAVARSGSLVVSGEPAGAAVFIDGERAGELSVDGLSVDLAVGEATVEVRAQDYESRSETVTIAAGHVTTLELSLEPITGLLTVTTGGVLAAVFLDEQARGQTPLSLELAPGKYRLRIEAPDHQVVERSVTVVGNEALEVAEELKLVAAGLTLSVTPDDAEVRINGELQTNRDLALPPGEYQLGVTAAGFEPQNLSLTLLPGDDERVTVSLTPQQAQINPEPEPEPGPEPSAEAIENAGSLRVTSNLPNTRIELTNLLDPQDPTIIEIPSQDGEVLIPEGFYDLRATAPQARPITDALDVRAGGSSELNLEFETVDLTVIGGVGNNEGELELLLIAQFSGRDVAGAITITGPEGWNEDQPLTPHPTGGGFQWLEGTPALSGHYTATFTDARLGELYTVFDIDSDDQLEPVSELEASSGDGMSASVSWASLERAVLYRVSIETRNGAILGSKDTEANSVTVSGLNLRPATSYFACVAAFNWPADGTLLAAAPLSASRICVSMVGPEEETTPGGRQDAGGPGPTPPTPTEPPPPPNF